MMWIKPILLCSHCLFQVRLGTGRGAKVVKVAVMVLYALLVAFGLNKALPLACIVCNSKHLSCFMHVISNFFSSFHVLMICFYSFWP